MIISLVTPSRKANKRYDAILDDGKIISFGLRGGKTYIDHKDKQLRFNYWARHYANKTERRLIKNLVPSPSLLSAMLLWNSEDLDKNVEILNSLWKFKKLI